MLPSTSSFPQDLLRNPRRQLSRWSISSLRILLLLILSWDTAAQPAVQEIIVTNNLVLAKGSSSSRLIVRTSFITIDGGGATLVGPGEIGQPKSMENAGPGILVDGATCVTVTNISVRGFTTGLVIRNSRAIAVRQCDFSDNYHNPAHGWGELPPAGGIRLERSRHCVLESNRANRVWNGLHLIDSDDNLVTGNDFSYCSNTGASLWKSSQNRFLNNNLSYGLRIDRAAGEVHARDSTGVLIETGSNHNYWYRNDITHGGDGIFIRPLNRWVSTGNVFVENDASYANNNCVESWSPGNTFIRNKANYGSYGFWLGGSDQTILIGNEAAFNGLTNGFHNAPEPGFRHGGIVLVSGSSSHTLLDGNDVHDNNGAGIVFRGDVDSKGARWKTEHWVVQRNRIADNQFGIWGRWGSFILFAGNTFSNNAQGNYLTNVDGLMELQSSGATPAPQGEIHGPTTAFVGEEVQFEATTSASGRPVFFNWWSQGTHTKGSLLKQRFHEPGFYRVDLTVENGSLATLAWRNLFILPKSAQEIGTEGQARRWTYDLELNESGQGRVYFEDVVPGIVGTSCLRFTPNPYPGAFATIKYRAPEDSSWNFATNGQMRFWIKAENPNLPGFQNAGPIVRLHAREGQIEFKPAKDANLLNDPPFSEARWSWMPITIPLAGGRQWQRSDTGRPTLDHIEEVSLSLDSWGGEPFTVWLDGLSVE